MAGEEPRLRIRGKLYAYPTGQKLGEPALIEQITGLTHSEWRKRQQDWLMSLLDDEAESIDDDLVWVGIIAIAIQREHPHWTRSAVVEFCNTLDYDEIEEQPGDVDPPASAEPSNKTDSSNGIEPVKTSSSDSDSDSKKSTTPQTSGLSTSDM